MMHLRFTHLESWHLGHTGTYAFVLTCPTIYYARWHLCIYSDVPIYQKMYQDIFSYTCTYRYILFTKIRTRTYWYVPVQVYRGISWYMTVQSGISLYIDIQSGTNTYIPVHTSLGKVHGRTYWYILWLTDLFPAAPARLARLGAEYLLLPLFSHKTH